MSLFKDKRVVYGALLGAATLIGALAYHYMSDSSEESTDALPSIGPVKRDGQGYIEFN